MVLRGAASRATRDEGMGGRRLSFVRVCLAPVLLLLDSAGTPARNRHGFMARPVRRTKQAILIPVAGTELRLYPRLALDNSGNFAPKMVTYRR
jgi:hypothetical protein